MTMKTANEWLNKWPAIPASTVKEFRATMTQRLEAVQADARNAGLEEAAQEIDKHPEASGSHYIRVLKEE